MAIKKFSPLLAENPLCGIGEYKDALDLSTGSVTRRVKKLVFTGEENFENYPAAGLFGVIFQIPDMMYNGRNKGVCTHFVPTSAPNGATTDGITFGANTRTLYIVLSQSTIDTYSISDVSSYKSYLAAQYAAGTPVTIWYVLATPETETITVPSGLTGTIEGYLTQSGTPTPSEPIYPEANPALTWVPTTYRKYGTETDVITALPAQIIGDGQPITSCQISGNTVQDGTPSPEAPVNVVGCGVRTGNLWNEDYTGISGKLKYVPVYVGNGSFTLSTSCPIINEAAALFFLAGNVQTGASSVSNGVYKDRSITVASISGYVTVVYRCVSYESGTANPQNEQTMLNLGSTALPYEPYGFKLPLAVNGVEYPIYLGQVETTRKIKKLVLTGDETWIYSISYQRFLINVLDFTSLGLRLTPFFSTHFGSVSDGRPITDVPDNTIYSGTPNPDDIHSIFIKTSAFTSLDEWKSYLAAQYAAGTPVTVWYVLAEPETAVINEPLHKIGDYADTVTATNVPITGILETFDVGTTLKPSEVQLTYHGWHEHTDTKYTQGE